MQELTRAQQEYFKDSKMRNANGDLQVFYHGTTHDFDSFTRNRRDGNMVELEAGFFFTQYKREADSYGINKGGQTLEVYLDIKNPLTLETKDDYALMNKYMAECFPGVNWQQEHICTTKFQNHLQKQGYDGLVTEGMIIVFQPNQIKSINNLYPTRDENFRDNSREYLSEHLKDMSMDECMKLTKHIKEQEKNQKESENKRDTRDKNER